MQRGHGFRHAEGTEAEILIGDTIGAEKGIVVKIERASITIRRGKTMTMIPGDIWV